ncbi:hypothetical protein R3P38DRAFT_3207031 [Favolaschia claudopus]|uniref:Uncharacterized protein n=1 Tax=Favolaschia claudopus TaxID=2862362 RepID=A0AAW0AK73_9AGAR
MSDFPLSDALGFTGGKVQRQKDIDQEVHRTVALLNPFPFNKALPSHYHDHVLIGPYLNVGKTNPAGLGDCVYRRSTKNVPNVTTEFRTLTDRSLPTIPDSRLFFVLVRRLRRPPGVVQMHWGTNFGLIQTLFVFSPTPRRLLQHTELASTPPTFSVAGPSRHYSPPAGKRVRKTRFGPPLPVTPDAKRLFSRVPRPQISPLNFDYLALPHSLASTSRPYSSDNLAMQYNIETSPLNPFHERLPISFDLPSIPTIDNVEPAASVQEVPFAHFSPQGMIINSAAEANDRCADDTRTIISISSGTASEAVVAQPAGKKHSIIYVSSGSSSSPLSFGSDTDLELGYPPNGGLDDKICVRVAVYGRKYAWHAGRVLTL